MSAYLWLIDDIAMTQRLLIYLTHEITAIK
jgi:hypothetical protein